MKFILLGNEQNIYRVSDNNKKFTLWALPVLMCFNISFKLIILGEQ